MHSVDISRRTLVHHPFLKGQGKWRQGVRHNQQYHSLAENPKNKLTKMLDTLSSLKHNGQYEQARQRETSSGRKVSR
jgi:hypothetical protein